MSGFLPQIIGGTNPTMQLNNLGSSYNSHYTQETEVNSVKWIIKNYNKDDLVYADRYGAWRLLAFGNFKDVLDDVLPSTIDKDSYVYSRYSNTLFGLNFKRYSGQFINFNFPTEFLDHNKNKIYNSGGSEIFK